MCKLTQVCLQLLWLPSLLFCSFKCLMCLSMSPGKACAAEAWDREDTSLSSNSAARERFSPGTDTELHHTGGKSGLGGIPGDVCFREISLFPLSDGPEPCLWESLSPMSFCWPPLQKDMAWSAWVGKLLELEVNLKSFCLHWFHQLKTVLNMGCCCWRHILVFPLASTSLSSGSFSVSASGQYGLHKKPWSHVISWYHTDFSGAWCPFGYCFCFRSFPAVLLPLYSLPFPFGCLLLPVITSENYKKADIYWRRRH